MHIAGNRGTGKISAQTNPLREEGGLIEHGISGPQAMIDGFRLAGTGRADIGVVSTRFDSLRHWNLCTVLQERLKNLSFDWETEVGDPVGRAFFFGRDGSG